MEEKYDMQGLARRTDREGEGERADQAQASSACSCENTSRIVFRTRSATISRPLILSVHYSCQQAKEKTKIVGKSPHPITVTTHHKTCYQREGAKLHPAE